MAAKNTGVMNVAGGEIVLYQPDESIKLEVRLDAGLETVWLNRLQMAELFGRDVKTVGKHINNALREELAPGATLSNNAPVGAKRATTQCREVPVVANFATTATDGKTYQVEYYNLDVILSVGYRVKSNQGIQFRRWANNVLKDYLLRGYSVNRQLIALQERTDERFHAIQSQLDEQQQQVEFLVDMHRAPSERVFPTGCVFDAWEYVAGLVRGAEKRAVLIDNYCDERTLGLLAKRKESVECVVYTRFTEGFERDLEKHNRQYAAIGKEQLSQKEHDRFLIVDDVVYILGDSLKDLGHSLTTVLKTAFKPEEILEKLR